VRTPHCRVAVAGAARAEQLEETAGAAVCGDGTHEKIGPGIDPSTIASMRRHVARHSERDVTRSVWSVGEHIEHRALAVKGVCEEFESAQPPSSRTRLTFSGRCVFWIGRIPRGRAQAAAFTRPQREVSAEEWNAVLDDIELRSTTLLYEWCARGNGLKQFGSSTLRWAGCGAIECCAWTTFTIEITCECSGEACLGTLIEIGVAHRQHERTCMAQTDRRGTLLVRAYRAKLPFDRRRVEGRDRFVRTGCAAAVELPQERVRTGSRSVGEEPLIVSTKRRSCRCHFRRFKFTCTQVAFSSSTARATIRTASGTRTTRAGSRRRRRDPPCIRW